MASLARLVSVLAYRTPPCGSCSKERSSTNVVPGPGRLAGMAPSASRDRPPESCRNRLQRPTDMSGEFSGSVAGVRLTWIAVHPVDGSPGRNAAWQPSYVRSSYEPAGGLGLLYAGRLALDRTCQCQLFATTNLDLSKARPGSLWPRRKACRNLTHADRSNAFAAPVRWRATCVRDRDTSSRRSPVLARRRPRGG